MKVTILDRILLMQILPAESDFATLKIVRGMTEKLGFNAEETKKFKIKTVQNSNGRGSSITWEKKHLKTAVDIKLIGAERKIIIDALEKLDKEKKATGNHLYLYDKIIKFHKKIEDKG